MVAPLSVSDFGSALILARRHRNTDACRPGEPYSNVAGPWLWTKNDSGRALRCAIATFKIYSPGAAALGSQPWGRTGTVPILGARAWL